MNADHLDRDLLSLIAQGDQTAFARFVERHQTRLYGLIFRFVRDPFTAEDLCQDTFFNIWKKAGEFRGEAAVSTWIYRLAVNACLNHRERQKRRLPTLPLAPDCQIAAPPDTPDPRTAHSEALLDQALALLPQRQRMALLLVGFSGHSYEDVAEIMKCSRGSVESLLFRARQNLAARLLPYKKKGEI